jgi:hypothetical protein
MVLGLESSKGIAFVSLLQLETWCTPAYLFSCDSFCYFDTNR